MLIWPPLFTAFRETYTAWFMHFQLPERKFPDRRLEANPKVGAVANILDEK
jgi:hypothetical protein